VGASLHKLELKTKKDLSKFLPQITGVWKEIEDKEKRKVQNILDKENMSDLKNF
jgi:hypothetical protein